jgi:hypothetical protein
MAGLFFTAIDAELTGQVVPIGTAPSAVAAGEAAPAAAAGRQVFAGRAAASPVGGDTQTLAIGAAAGAVLTLIGVLVGYRLGRRH